MTDNELLLAMSEMMDNKLKPMNDRLKRIELMQEKTDNKLKPMNDRLKKIELMQEKTDNKLKPMNDRLKRIELMQENDILPRLQNIEACYTSTYRRYANGIEDMETLKADMEVVKKVVVEHSEHFQRIG